MPEAVKFYWLLGKEPAPTPVQLYLQNFTVFAEIPHLSMFGSGGTSSVNLLELRNLDGFHNRVLGLKLYANMPGPKLFFTWNIPYIKLV